MGFLNLQQLGAGCTCQDPGKWPAGVEVTVIGVWVSWPSLCVFIALYLSCVCMVDEPANRHTNHTQHIVWKGQRTTRQSQLSLHSRQVPGVKLRCRAGSECLYLLSISPGEAKVSLAPERHTSLAVVRDG